MTSSSGNEQRVLSVDILRGLIILLMIFVNDVAGVPGAPSWLLHVDANADAMTLADIVFPAFLFICGISIPLAWQASVRRGSTFPQQSLHVLCRTVSLLVLGVLMVNADSFARPWRPGLWPLLVYLASIVGWIDLPKSLLVSDFTKRLIRYAGWLGLAVLAALFVNSSGQWLQTQWWGILGLIGWAYLVGVLAFTISRGATSGLVASAALLLALFIADRSSGLQRMQSRAWLADQQSWFESLANAWRAVDSWVGLGTTVGTLGAIVVLGAVLGTIIAMQPSQGWPATLRKAFFLMIGCLVGGFLLDGAYGINKIQATPTWALWSSAATIALWMTVASIVDWQGWRFGWYAMALVGMNPLLAYLLHPILLFALEVTRFDLYGLWPRITSFSELYRSGAVAICIGLVTAWITKLGFRLRL